MSVRSLLVCGAALLAHAKVALADVVIPVEQSVMTSSFFQGADTVRGYPEDNRNVLRVSTENPFVTVGAETVYLTFNFDFNSLTGPVPEAILRVTSVAGGFGADADADHPFLIAAHGLSADPLSSITDNTNLSGPIHWLDFYHGNLLEAAPEARTSVTGFGTLEFDVTALVNSWITGGNTVFALALSGKYDTSGNEFLHGIENDAESPGVSHSLTIVPEPSSVLSCAIGGLLLAAFGLKRLRVAACH